MGRSTIDVFLDGLEKILNDNEDGIQEMKRTSKAQVSSDLKEYLFEILAMSMSWVRSAPGELTIWSSGGLAERISYECQILG